MMDDGPRNILNKYPVRSAPWSLYNTRGLVGYSGLVIGDSIFYGKVNIW